VPMLRVFNDTGGRMWREGRCGGCRGERLSCAWRVQRHAWPARADYRWERVACSQGRLSAATAGLFLLWGGCAATTVDSVPS
jgi:hypothetical protein